MRLVRALARSSFPALCLATVLGSAGCSDIFSSSSPDDGPAPADGGVVLGTPGCPGTTLPSQDACSISDDFAVFVSPKGSDAAVGSMAQPFAHIQTAIDHVAGTPKRIYVCADTYEESLVMTRSVSIFGYFDCSTPTWTVSSVHARILSPKSPALLVQTFNDAARFEGFEADAPDTTDPSTSSIAMVAIDATPLTMVDVVLRAGHGGDGKDGVDGLQLTPAPGRDGAPSIGVEDCCTSYTVQKPPVCNAWNMTCVARHQGSSGKLGFHEDMALGGKGQCLGATGYDGGNGGNGGPGGRYTASTGIGNSTTLTQEAPNAGELVTGAGWGSDPGTGAGGSTHNAPGPAAGAAGATGTDGASGAEFGAVTDKGEYLAADGKPGTSGKPGGGGGGGGGRDIGGGAISVNEGYTAGESVYAPTGSGGGAGGCPGLAGTPGTGGGASIALLAVRSPLTLEHCTLQASNGGRGGHGTQGSKASPGGAPGGTQARVVNEPPNPSAVPYSGAAGGAGGAAGASGSGGGGPSIGIAFTPKTSAPSPGDSQLLFGNGGDGAPTLNKAGLHEVPASARGYAGALRAF